MIAATASRKPTMTGNDPLLQPLQLKHLSIKNRVMSASHEPAYSAGGKPGLRYQLYQEEKAKGGMGLTMFGGSTNVAVDSPAVFGNLDAGDDSIIPSFRQLAARVHRHGCAVMCQITHLGRRTVWNAGHWLPTISASCVREPAHRSFPKEMEDWDIRRVAQNYADGARRCKEGGLDGVEIEAYGHLFDTFWSPNTNKRSDRYGGSLQNRMRFSLRTLAAIRKSVGGDFIVGIRMVLDEDMEGGLQYEEGIQIARALVGTGHLDFVNVIKGYVSTDEGIAKVIPNMGTPAAPHLEFAGRVKAELGGIPVFHAARINDVATARYAVGEGLVDMVGMVRAHMADPHITAKVQRGEEQRIRPCVGAGYCIDRLYEPGDALCIHNPATGREETIPHIITRAKGAPRRVTVVGAGPAGLEAARVSAERGHAVTLLEAAAAPGGQVALAAKLERRREIMGIVDWRVAELEHLGVTIQCSTLAGREEVLAADPEVVVIATGGLPNTDVCTGAMHAVSTWDILSGQVAPAKTVLLFDDSGQHQAMSCAEFIARRGAQLEIVTPDRMIGHEIGGTNYPAYYKIFFEKGVATTTSQRLRGIAQAPGGGLVARFQNDFDKSFMERTADQVIVEHGTLPADDLYFALKPDSINLGETDYTALTSGRPQTLTANPAGKFQLFRIGDAVSSRNIHAALLDAVRLCKDL